MYDDPSLIPPPDLPPRPLPTDPAALAELDRDIAVAKALASDEEIRWLIREVGTPPALLDDPNTWDAMSYKAGLAVRSRSIENPPFSWTWDAIRRINRVDETTDPFMVAFWERLRRGMERLASPDWRP